MSIAVLVTTHNSSAVILETLQSLSTQDRKPDEVLIIDDKSTDHTLDLVENWSVSQPFAVQIMDNQFSHDGYPCGGPAGSRTTGLLRTEADLIGVLDHDDLMLPSHLRLTEQALLRNPDMELCFGDTTVFSDDASLPERSFFQGKSIEGLRYKEAEFGLRILTEPILESLVNGSYIPTSANLWRRKSGIAIGGFDRRAGGCDDLRFFSSISRLGCVGYFPFAISRKRSHSGNMSHSRHGLSHCWHQIIVLRLMQNEARQLALTAREESAVDEALKRFAAECLYQASLQGWNSYRDFRKFVDDVEMTTSKDLVRAIYSTVRLLLRRRQNGLPEPSVTRA